MRDRKQGGQLAVLLFSWILAMVGCAGPGAVRSYARPPIRGYPARTLTMPSGLEVVFERDPTLPMVGILWAVRAGSTNDPTGREGLAHLVEHLAFRSPDADGRPVLDHLRLMSAMYQGETTADATTYHSFIERGSLRELFRFMADWLADPLRGVDEERFGRELGVVHEELDSRDPIGSGHQIDEAMRAAMFPAGHPLRRPVGGTDSSLDTIKLGDAQGFVARYYQPRNMVAIVSGDFELDQITELLAMLPPSLRGDTAHPVAPVHLKDLPAHLEEATGERVTKITAHVPSPEVWVGWPLPPAGEDPFPQSVLLGLARSMRPVLPLRKEGDGDPTEDVGPRATVELHSTRLGSWLVCGGALAEGADPEAAVEAILHEYSRLWVYLDYDHDWFERHRALVTTRLALESSRLDERLELSGRMALFDPSVRFNDLVTRASTVPRIEIAKIAANYVLRPKARVVIVSPSQDPPRAAKARASFENARSGDATDLAPASLLPEGHRLADLVRPAVAARAEVGRLSNGLEVIVLPRPALPVSTITLAFHGAASPHNGAVRDAFLYAARMRYRRKSTDLGVWLTTRMGPDLMTDALEVLHHDEPNAINFLGRSFRSLDVEWPSDSFSDSMSRRQTRESTADGRATHAFLSALWGRHPYGADPLAAEVEEVETAEVESWTKHIVRPGNGVLVAVGDVESADIMRRAEAELGSWKVDSLARAEAPAPPPLRTTGSLRVLKIQKPGAHSSKLRLGCLLPPVNDFAGSIADDVLAMLVRNRLFEELRQQLGTSYSPHSSAHIYRGGAAIMVAETDVSTGDVPSALRVVEHLMDERAPAFGADAFEQARFVLARQSSFRFGTSEAIAAAIVTFWNMGWPPSTLDEYQSRLLAVTEADVARALHVCRANAVMTVLTDAP